MARPASNAARLPPPDSRPPLAVEVLLRRQRAEALLQLLHLRRERAVLARLGRQLRLNVGQLRLGRLQPLLLLLLGLYGFERQAVREELR